ncbi:hypothetical protein ACJMK2_037965 [Sinanodonta woodiana]|uniref:VWFA domain-containing protein n=1 Tax=Sinanodonta woodiana TaxID=1069815 RepID=A0ABD3WM37_SINWO
MNGGRDNVAKLVIVLTDVNSLYPVNTAEEAKLLHWSEVKVIPIGIGSSIGQTELQNIAVDSKFVFNVSGFDALHTIERQVLTQACKIESGCSGQADIVFILDSTSSEGAVNFNKLLQFVSNFIKQFAVGPNDVQFGMVTFSTYAKAEFYLNTYTDKLSLLSKVQSVTYNGGSSALYYGLHNANMYQFQTQNGARPNARKIAIILTERRSTDVSRTINEAHLLQQKGVKVISIGIGNNVIQYELTNIASSKSDVYTIGSFDILHTIETDLKSTACGGKMAPTPNPECGTSAADIVFVLDSSSSEGTDNFHRQLDFVRDFSYQFKIGYQNVQISVVVFSSTVHEAFPLNKYTNDTSLLAAISRVAYIGGTTNTDLALSYVRQHSFLPSNGGRSNVTDIIIVITDGQSTYPSKTKIEAELLKNRTNTKVITIGIGSSVDRTELQVISSDHSHAFEVPNFTALQQITSELTFAACQTCSFVQKADIVFMLDASSSEGDTNFQKQLDFVSRLSNDFSIGKDQVQIGLITFATYPKNEFYLNTYTTKSTLLSQIQRVAYMNGQTYTDQGLEFARSNSFTPVHGDRRDAQNYLIILTDGASANPSNTLAAAQHLKQQGIRIIAIGIGNNINRNELYGIASDSNHVFTVTSFTALQQIREEIKQAACAGKRIAFTT